MEAYGELEEEYAKLEDLLQRSETEIRRHIGVSVGVYSEGGAIDEALPRHHAAALLRILEQPAGVTEKLEDPH
jgi:hypothetical protein